MRSSSYHHPSPRKSRDLQLARNQQQRRARKNSKLKQRPRKSELRRRRGSPLRLLRANWPKRRSESVKRRKRQPRRKVGPKTRRRAQLLKRNQLKQ